MCRVLQGMEDMEQMFQSEDFYHGPGSFETHSVESSQCVLTWADSQRRGWSASTTSRYR